MTAVCPAGHATATTDYCDQCGAPIARAPAGPDPVEEVDTSTTARHAPCPACAAARSGDDRFCEGCGYDFVGPAPTAPAAWEAVAVADPGQFARYAGSTSLVFPAACPERRFRLAGAEVRIGRRRARPDELVPDIDVAAATGDPAVSHLHAILERQPDGSYAVRDLGSTNGTTLNDDPAPIGADVAVAIADGDRVRLGAWTTITLKRT